jgi:metal transporter CNNM
VHKAIRRIAPAPRTRYTKGNTVVDAPATDDDTDADERTHLLGPKDSSSQSRKSSLSGSREATLLLRRRSSTSSDKNRPLPMRSNTADLRQHLKHLGPSNVASRPKATKYSSVKIKPGVGTIPENRVPTAASTHEAESSQAATSQTVVNGDSSRPEGGIGAGLIGSAALEAQDGAHAVAHGYGSISPGSKNPSIHEESEVQAEHEAIRSSEAISKMVPTNLPSKNSPICLRSWSCKEAPPAPFLRTEGVRDLPTPHWVKWKKTDLESDLVVLYDPEVLPRTLST